jgi:hypothetical protein
MARTKNGDRSPSHSSNLDRIPRRNVGPWCQDIIKKCLVSQMDRARFAETMRSFYFTGTPDGQSTLENEMYPEIDHLASALFSPVDPRLYIGFDRSETPENRAMARTTADYLSREFRRRGVDATFADAVNWGLVEASTFMKLLWNRQGFDPYLVSQSMMGVYNEATVGLDRQDAFVHSSFMTFATFQRTMKGHPEEDSILRAVKRSFTRRDSPGMDREGGIRQLLIGGTIPVNLAPPASGVSNNGGWVAWVKGPKPTMEAQTLAELIQFDELWVIDNEREDYTTFQLVGDIVIEGKLQRRNLCGIKGLQPFTQVCPNPIKDYFWGRSEIQNLMVTQMAISSQIAGIDHTMRMGDDPPMSFIGVSGNIDQKRSALMKVGGRLAEVNPNASIKSHAPELPPQALPYLEKLVDVFHRQSGFEAPVSRGMGEQGVRSGVHGDTMVRMASPRVRDRALLVERTYSELGDVGLQILQAKVGDEFSTTVEGQHEATKFLLTQLPDDYDLSVDSHSTSPAFSEEARRLAFDLAKAKAVDDIGLLRLTHPPQEDTLIADAEDRRKKQAAMLAQHPELLRQPGGKR